MAVPKEEAQRFGEDKDCSKELGRHSENSLHLHLCPSPIFGLFHRIPQQNGSCSSSNCVASAFTNAVPVMTGETFPAARSSQRNLPSNVLPMMLSCTHVSPSASLASAARQAS